MEKHDLPYKANMNKAYKKANKIPYDKRTMEQQIEACLPFAYGFARKISIKTQIPLEDLVSEANLGLCEAAERYDRTSGAKFITYAFYKVKFKVLEYVDRYVKRQHKEVLEELWTDDEESDWVEPSEEPVWEIDTLGILTENGDDENNDDTLGIFTGIDPEHLQILCESVGYECDKLNLSQIAEKHGYRNRNEIRCILKNVKECIKENVWAFGLEESDVIGGLLSTIPE